MTEIAGNTAPRRRSRRRSLSFAVPVVAVVAVAAVASGALLGRGSDAAWASAVQVARAAPRLVVSEPGWSVMRADEFSADDGGMTFARGDQRLELRWGPGRDYAVAVEKRNFDQDSLGTLPVAGDSARVFRYPVTNDFTAIWLRGSQTIEARGIAPSVDAFKATVASLRKVDVDTWLSAMPDSVVKPASRSEVVGEMLADVPLPDGFDAASLRRGDAIRDRYQLGAQVTGAVACAWIDRWIVARRADDDGGVRRAVTAMASSTSWPILLEMDEEGDYPEVLWELAGAMGANSTMSGGKPLTIEESYRSALGCPGA